MSFNAEQLRKELNESTISIENRWASLFLFVCLTLLSSFIGWAYWAEITEITRGQGKVIPSSYQQTIQSLDGGILDELKVTEGEVVNAGQVLLILNNTRFKAAYTESYNQSLVLQATLSRLEAEVLNLNSVIYPENLRAFNELIDTENKLFEARKQRLKSSTMTFKKRIKATEEQLKIVKALVQRKAAGSLELMKLKSDLAEQYRQLTETINAFMQ